MHMLDSVKRQLTPVHPEGYKFIAIFAVATVALAWLWQPLGWLGAILTCWCIYFFRDRPGLFVNADLDKASDDNVRNAVVVETPRGRFGVVQIAGLVARRIVCFNKQGDTLAAGARFGLIRFGSRVDVYCPHAARPLVAVGSKAVAGETVLADYGSEAEKRLFRAE